MRKLLLLTVAAIGLTGLAATGASAAPGAAGIHPAAGTAEIGAPTGGHVIQADYYHNHHRYHHRRWSHGHWHYSD
jgi:hypothetical protein